MNLEPRVAQHLILPAHVRETLDVCEGESIAVFLERAQWTFTLPTICVVNGTPVLRAEWSVTVIGPEDTIYFLSKPHLGGSGSGGSKGVQVAALIGVIALAAIAPWAAGALGFAAGTFGFYAAVAAITIGGGLLLSTFLRPKTGDQNNQQKDQLYSLTAAGNTSKPFQPVPVQYGRLKSFPDYVATPYSDPVGNDSYLNVALSLGLGKYQIEEIYADDVLIWDFINGYSGNFTNTYVQGFFPGDPVTLFPINIRQSPDVSDFEVPAGTGTIATNNAGPGPWSSAFICNDPSTQTDQIFFDFIFPVGLFIRNKADATYQSYQCLVEGQIQAINDVGTALGGWVDLFSTTITLNTQNPTRYTIPKPITAGRYQVRVRRYAVINTGQEFPASPVVIADDIILGTLRANIVGPITFNDITVLAIRMQANGQLTQQSAKKFGVVCTRMLPVWNGSAFVEAATKNPFWAFYDAATNTSYGAKFDVTKVDFQSIYAQALNADTRGDAFNFRFDTALVVPEAFDKILGAARTKHNWAGDILSCVRDEYRPIPQMLINDSQIERNSLQVTYNLNDTNQSDCVVGQFINEQTWLPASVQYPPNGGGFTGVQPTNLKLEGITDEAQAYRETAFFYLQAILRRQKIQFNTEHDGRILKFGSVIKVQSYLPRSWGQSGEILSSNTGTHTLTADRNLAWDAVQQNFLELRDNRGRYWGPVKVSRGAGDNLIVIDMTDEAIVAGTFGFDIWTALVRMDGAEPPAFVLGAASYLSRTMIVLRGQPSGEKVTIQGVVDNPAVHTTDLTTAPPLPTAVGPTDPTVPQIQALHANFRQGVAEPILDVGWAPAPGAVTYQAQVSYDGGIGWAPVYNGLDPSFSAVVTLAAIRVRVAAIGASRRGAWVFVDVDAPTIEVAPGVVSPASFLAGLRDYVTTQLTSVEDSINKTNQTIAAAAAEQDAHNALDATHSKTIQSAQYGNLNASITTVADTVVSQQTALASLTTTVTAQGGAIASNSASITVNATAIATVSGDLAARYTLSLNVNGYVSGFQSTNNGVVANFVIIADNFLIARPASGAAGSPVPIFTVSTVSGSPKVALRADVYADGDITTRNLTALSVTGDKIAANSIDATKIVAGSISTDQLSVGGVDIHNLALGAATNISTGNGTPQTILGNALHNVGTITFTSVGGALFILGVIGTTDGTIAAGSGAVASANASTDFRMAIDGVTIDSWTNTNPFQLVQVSASSFQEVHAAGSPLAILHSVANVSAGLHSITLFVQMHEQPGVTNASGTVNKAFATIFESRR